MPFEAYKTLQMLQPMDNNESLDPRLRLSLAALGENFTNVMSVANARFKFIEERDNTHVPGEWPAGRSSNTHLLVRQLMTDCWCPKQINKMRSMTTSAWNALDSECEIITPVTPTDALHC
jgi:hypothetical protein